MLEHLDGEITKLMEDVVSIKINDTMVEVPRIINDLFCFIENKVSEGIFRVSGSARRMKEYVKNLSEYPSWLYDANIHDVCGLFKKMTHSSLRDAFTVKLCEEIKVLYMEYIREVEMEEERLLQANECSDDSFNTAQTSVANVHLDRIARKFAILLVEKSPERKNHLFLYIIDKLNCLQKYVNVTKMTTTNLAIIFQPLIFTGDLHELILFQKFLYLLISDSKEFISAYGKYSHESINKFADIEVHPFLASRMASVDELQTYDENPSSFSRRKSLSNRLSVLLTNYYVPASKLKGSLRQAIQSKESLVNNEEEEILNSVGPLPTEFNKSKEDLCSSIGSSENNELTSSHLECPSFNNPIGLKSNSSEFSNNKSRDSLFQTMDNINKESNTHSTENLLEPIPDNDNHAPGTLKNLILEESNIKAERRKSFLDIFKNPKYSLLTGDLLKTVPEPSHDIKAAEELKPPAMVRRKSLFRRSFSLKIKSRKN